MKIKFYMKKEIKIGYFISFYCENVQKSIVTIALRNGKLSRHQQNNWSR